MLRRLLVIAVIAGAAAGLVASALQGAKLWPLIAAAEVLEQGASQDHAAGAAHAPTHAPHANSHDDEGWAPEDGAERIAYTVLFNILTGFGFALLLNGALALRATVAQGGGPLNAGTGALWGVAGFVSFALAPALGLPPELPGMVAADLLERQVWWGFAAVATAAGLALLVWPRSFAWKALGIVVLVLPHVAGAPHGEGHGTVPAELAAEFVAASLVAAAAFWLVLGAVSGWLHRRLA